MKYLKRFLWTTLFIFLAALGVGYYYGLRPNNYQELISNIISKIFSKEKDSTDEGKDKTKPSKQKRKPKGKNEDTAAPELQPLPQNPFARVDKYARQCPKTAEETIESLSSYLQVGMQSDLDKARAIYIWLTENIAYDDDGFNSDLSGDYSAEGVLLSRKAVCEGFSNLFLALGLQMGLEIEKVIGYSKGYGYSPGDKFKESNHAWNIIKINGSWRVFDATWGRGNGTNVNGKLKSKKEFNGYWFNVDPYEAILSHLPEDSKYAFVQPALSLSHYEKLPDLYAPLYFGLGFSGKETYKKIFTDASYRLPDVFDAKTFVQLYSAPPQENLLVNESQKFEFFIPRGFSVAVIDEDNNWTYFNKDKGKFKLDYTPKIDGELTIGVKSENSGELYQTILVYKVVKQKAST